MIRLLSIIAVLLLTGCGSRTQQNVGAQIQVYVGSAQHMFDMIPPGNYRGLASMDGYTELPSGRITVSEQIHEWRLVEVWTHELVRHALPLYLDSHPGPFDPDAFLRQYEGRGLDFNLYKEPTP